MEDLSCAQDMEKYSNVEAIYNPQRAHTDTLRDEKSYSITCSVDAAFVASVFPRIDSTIW
jgi:hypothetical protein